MAVRAATPADGNLSELELKSFRVLNDGSIVQALANADGSNISAVSYGNVVTLTAGAVVSVDPNLGSVFKLTPGEDETLNAASVPSAGQRISLVVTTSGTTSRTLTFGTNFKSTGTLATGTTTAKVFTVNFVSDGVNWNETSRTTAM